MNRADPIELELFAGQPGTIDVTTPPDWRLRADPQTKAYRIERRGEGGWQAIASFLVHAGDCREPERVLPEPPAEAEPKP